LRQAFHSSNILLRAIALFCIFASSAFALGMVDPEQDFAFLEFEPYPSFQGKPPAAVESSQRRFWRLAGQMSFPAGTVAGHPLFGSFKSTLIDRDIVYDSTVLNDGILKRFWLSGGGQVMDNPRTSGVFLAGVGVNSDFADLGLLDFNTEWIYVQSFKFNANFHWGVGMDVQQYFHKYQPYPLIFVDWKISPKTKFKWDADYIELRRFMTPLLCLTAGVRFNLEFFALKQDADYEYNSMGLETGLQYAVGGNCYLRLKYKELMWGRETLGLVDGSHHTHGIDAGRSLRLNFAYGI
jgi:hypothetical protein